MPRPIWKGVIAFGLVTIPVILYSAEKREENIRFHLVDGRDRARIRYKRVNEQTGKEVPWEAIEKAYEFEKDDYVLISREEMKKFEADNARTIEIDSFIEQKSLNFLSFKTPYYLVPDKKGEKGYVILRETLAKTHKIAIARVMIHTREYLAAVFPYENALILDLLRYQDDIRKISELDLPSQDLKKYKITAGEINVATELIASMTRKWQPEKWHDEHRNALQKWIEKAVHNQKPRGKNGKNPARKARPDNVIDFIALMKKSMKPSKQASHRTVSRRRK